MDAPDGLSARAASLLVRTGRREPPQELRLATDFLRVRDRFGQLVPAPMVLAVRREGFEQRYGGLRYRVRNTFTLNNDRLDAASDWWYDLGHVVQADGVRGWYFDWFGEHVSSPVRYLVHTDGRVGVDDGGGFLEIAPSVSALIESHALTDLFSTWERTAHEIDSFAIARQIAGLTDVPEASGPTIRWRISDTVAVQEFQNWSSQEPRRWRAFIWSQGQAGRRRIERATIQAAARASR